MTDPSQTNDDTEPTETSSKNAAHPDENDGGRVPVSRRGALAALGTAGLFGLFGTETASAKVLSGVNNTAPAGTQVVAGGKDNTATGIYAAILGGLNNRATARLTTVGGGGGGGTGDLPDSVGGGTRSNGNRALDGFCTVAGGRRNQAGTPGSDQADASFATVSGGQANTAYRFATISGGQDNTSSGEWSTVGGGARNTASGESSTIPGGAGNIASGPFSFATGHLAMTESPDGTPHAGAVVFADSTETEFRSKGPNEFRSQMPMFAPSFNTTSARASKTAVEPVDPGDVLDAVTELEVSTWEFADTDDGRHMGPMAGEFHDAFALGADDETIASVDADGVSLAAIQGLADRLDEKDARIDRLEEENETLRDRYAELEGRLAALEDEGDAEPAPEDRT